MLFTVINGFVIEVLCHFIAKVPAARVDHDPDETVFVLLQFDEVVAATQGTQLIKGAFYLFIEQTRLLEFRVIVLKESIQIRTLLFVLVVLFLVLILQISLHFFHYLFLLFQQFF